MGSSLIMNQYEQEQRKALVLLSDAFYTARAARGFSQEFVALQAGMAVATYNQLERGFSCSGVLPNPTLITLIRVMTTLEIDPASLFSRSTATQPR
jgi:transcriptional regulator with XRE-family HTH domain